MVVITLAVSVVLANSERRGAYTKVTRDLEKRSPLYFPWIIFEAVKRIR